MEVGQTLRVRLNGESSWGTIIEIIDDTHVKVRIDNYLSNTKIHGVSLDDIISLELKERTKDNFSWEYVIPKDSSRFTRELYKKEEIEVNDGCKTENVILQENGIVRNINGDIIGRMERSESTFMTKDSHRLTRELYIGTKEHTKVLAADEPDVLDIGVGACPEYKVVASLSTYETEQSLFAEIFFQKGPVKECGVNGCHNEDLIAIVIDRLSFFQKGDYACPENFKALLKLEEALYWLKERTSDRKAQGIEGTSKSRSTEGLE